MLYRSGGVGVESYGDEGGVQWERCSVFLVSNGGGGKSFERRLLEARYICV